MESKTIKYRGVNILIDKEDLPILYSRKWTFTRMKSIEEKYYLSCSINKKTEYLHRTIIQAKKGQLVDHVNCNLFDLRKINLRLTTQKNNCQNRTKTIRPTSSPYKGVFKRNRKSNNYYAAIGHNKKSIWLGSFSDPILAAKAYNQAAIKLFGKFAKINDLTERHELIQKTDSSSQIIKKAITENIRQEKTQKSKNKEVLLLIKKINKILKSTTKRNIQTHIPLKLRVHKKHKTSINEVELYKPGYDFSKEIWKDAIGIRDIDAYEISDLGRLREKSSHKIIPALLLKGQPYLVYRMPRVDNRVLYKRKYIHNLVAVSFLERYQTRGSSPFVATEAYLIDGNPYNVKLSNIKFKTKKRRRYRSDFPKGKEAIIAQIEENTTDKNKEDNKILIDWLSGNKQAIWTLFLKHEKFYEIRLRSFIKYGSSGHGGQTKTNLKKSKESAIELHDIIMDNNIKIMKQIKNGRFDGRDYRAWSGMVLRNYMATFFKRQKDRMKDVLDVKFY